MIPAIEYCRWGRASHFFPMADWTWASFSGKSCLAPYIFISLLGAVTGWIDVTFTYTKRFVGNDFTRYCLVVVVSGDDSMKRPSSRDRSLLKDRRQSCDPYHSGSERRSGEDRRNGTGSQIGGKIRIFYGCVRRLTLSGHWPVGKTSHSTP